MLLSHFHARVVTWLYTLIIRPNLSTEVNVGPAGNDECKNERCRSQRSSFSNPENLKSQTLRQRSITVRTTQEKVPVVMGSILRWLVVPPNSTFHARIQRIGLAARRELENGDGILIEFAHVQYSAGCDCSRVYIFMNLITV